MGDPNIYKQQAAERSLELIQSGMALGLGTGSTATLMLHGLAARMRAGQLRDIVGVPTSQRTADLALALGIPLVTLDARPELDLALDGADEIDPQLGAIKGLGAALLREKIVAASAKRFVLFADAGKLVQQLGTRTPVPVETIAFGLALVTRRIEALGARPELRRNADGAPIITDEGNVIVDAHFGVIADPERTAAELNAIPGAVDHGLFLNIAQQAIVAGPDGVRVIAIAR